MNFLSTLMRRGEKNASPKAAPIDSICEDPIAEKLIRDGAYCRLLLEQAEHGWEDDAVLAAGDVLQNEMAYVPAGAARIQSINSSDRGQGSFVEVQEPAFFVDRYAVTNAQFERFVNSDGYRDPEYWPEDIFPLLFQFVDETENPGPRFWEDGAPLQELRDHPVVGISWYEANAYATWVGKTLPTSPQWQRSGTWWKPNVRHPWGNSFEYERSHTGVQDERETVPVSEFPDGATPNDIFQLVGNVWEWTDTIFDQVEIEGKFCHVDDPLGEIRGGAFDTYLSSQANCLFRSGQSLLSRTDNIGFRCCLGTEGLELPGGSSDEVAE